MADRDRIGIATILIVLLLLQASAAYAVGSPNHEATAGSPYKTNSGLEVELGDDRTVEAVPFADNQTFRSDGVNLSAPAPASVRVTDQTFDGDTMQLSAIDTNGTTITATRDTLNTNVTIEGGASAAILHNVTLGDGQTDIEITAASQTTLTLTNITGVDGVQAVDASGAPVASDSDTSNGEAELTLDAGQYDIRLQSGPSSLKIRDVTTGEVITTDSNGDPINITVEFFGADDTVVRETTDTGTVDMSGLPADKRFSVTVDANDEYVQRQIIIPSILQQQSAYVLPVDANLTTVEPRFTLEDPTNQFDPQDSEIIVSRPINDTTTTGTEFKAVAGDRIGTQGFDVILERDQRYRITVLNPATGQTREVGAFTPTQSEEVTLEVEDVAFDSVSEVNGLEWTGRYVERENKADQIQFIYRDQFATLSIDYAIYERGNRSNELVDSTASGNVTLTELVPPGGEDTVWMVEFTAERANGDTLEAQRPVSTDSLPVGPSELPQNWQTMLAMVGLLMIAGLFGAANPAVGGIAVAGTGGLFFTLGWLPDSTGGLMVVLALFIAVLSYAARRARGASA